MKTCPFLKRKCIGTDCQLSVPAPVSGGFCCVFNPPYAGNQTPVFMPRKQRGRK